MLTRIGRGAARTARRSPHTDVVGLGRTMLALATLATLLVNATPTLFAPAPNAPGGPACVAADGLSLFCLVGNDRLELARWAAVGLLAVVAAGWRPRWTALPHWWITWSVASSVTVTDGGDQIAASLTLLLVPIALTDRRRWHWHNDDDLVGSTASELGRLPLPDQRRRVVAHGFVWLLRLQVAGIYLHAAISKLGQPEWADGTALYYWLGNPVFGLPPWARPAVDPVLQSGIGVTAMTWGVIVLEVALAAGLVVEKSRRAPLLAGGIVLHVGIIGMGLVSFAVIMCAALVVYLRPVEQPLSLSSNALRLLGWLSVRRSPGSPVPADGAAG